MESWKGPMKGAVVYQVNEEKKEIVSPEQKKMMDTLTDINGKFTTQKEQHKKWVINCLRANQQAWLEPKAGKIKARAVRLHVEGEAKRVTVRPLAPGVYKMAKDNEWAAPIVVVPKKGTEQVRMCIDYRDLQLKLRDKKHFTTLDLNWGFWAVPLTDDSVKYTGFMVPGRGILVSTVLPFGLKISPTEFQSVMEDVFETFLNTNEVFIYIDDIIIATATIRRHLQLLNQILQKMINVGLFLN
eukprot:Selendium_serpulae@DN6344_c0_g1_i1.p1